MSSNAIDASASLIFRVDAEIALWVVIATVMLLSLYQHQRLNWPLSYFDPAETLTAIVTRSPLRFIVFRFLLPYLVFLCVGIYASQPDATIWWVAVSYTVCSSYLSVRSSVRHEPGSVRLTWRRCAVIAVIAAGLLVVAWIAVKTAPRMRLYAPEARAVVSDLVAAVIAAAMVIAYVNITSQGRGGLGASRLRLSEEMETQIRAIAIENSVDPRLAVAIARVENAQRPPWLRRVERLALRAGLPVTTGLFQVQSKTQVSDIESCAIAMAGLSGSFVVFDPSGRPAAWSIRACAELHNPDVRFAEAICDAYYDPAAPFVAEAETAPDGRPMIDVLQVGRFAQRIRLRGTAWCEDDASVVAYAHALRSSSASAAVPEGSGLVTAQEAEPQSDVDLRTPYPLTVVHAPSKGERRGWWIDLSLSDLVVNLSLHVGLGECMGAINLRVDLRNDIVERDLTLMPERGAR